MQKEPLTVEWEYVPIEDDEERLVRVFDIILNKINEYEEQQQEENI